MNVSRSYLQSDSNVKKISTYITKKVADRLASLFKEDRKAYEEKWDNLKIFINYGMLSQEDFYDRAKVLHCSRIGGWIYIPGFIMGLGGSFMTAYKLYLAIMKTQKKKKNREHEKAFNRHV